MVTGMNKKMLNTLTTHDSPALMVAHQFPILQCHFIQRAHNFSGATSTSQRRQRGEEIRNKIRVIFRICQFRVS